MIHRIADGVIRPSGVPWRVPFRLFPFFCLAMLVATLAGDASGTPLTVSATSASLTDAPSADAQVLGRVSQGSRLVATGRKSGDWLEIQAPAAVSGWVYGELVRDGRIAASSVKVRSGPGIGYISLGTLEKGAPVESRGRQGDWLEIAGQPLFAVWVERAMVAGRAVADFTAPSSPVVPAAELPVTRAADPPLVAVVPPVPALPPALPPVASPPPVVRPVASPVASTPPVALAAVPPVTVAPPPVARPVVSPAPAASGGRGSPIGRRLIATAPQGEPVMVSGVLRPVGFALFPAADYRLVGAGRQGPARTVCYVAGAERLFQGRIGRVVTVEGRKYWPVGSREPVVLVSSIR